MLGNYRVAAQLVASRVVLRSTELVKRYHKRTDNTLHNLKYYNTLQSNLNVDSQQTAQPQFQETETAVGAPTLLRCTHDRAIADVGLITCCLSGGGQRSGKRYTPLRSVSTGDAICYDRYYFTLH
jgi:hypothetical protein